MSAATARFVFAMLFLFVFAHASAVAQDTVITRGEKSGATSKRRGEILDWQGNILTLQVGSRTREIKGERIVRVETTWNQAYIAGKKLLNKNQFKEAIPKLREAVGSEPRDWAKNVIRADLVEAYSAVEQPLAAIEEFQVIIATDPESRFMALVPLSWTGSVGGADVRNATERWLESREPILQLIAASWHLGGKNRQKSVSLLRELSNDFEPRIAYLAGAQVWRTQVTNLNESAVDAWKSRIEQMPKALQAGPWYVLGTAQARVDEQANQSALSFMRVPILFPRQHHLVAASLYKCGSVLHNESRSDEAKSVWRELLQKYPDSIWASQVDRSKLNN